MTEQWSFNPLSVTSQNKGNVCKRGSRQHFPCFLPTGWTLNVSYDEMCEFLQSSGHHVMDSILFCVID